MPLIVFDQVIYEISVKFDLDFLSFRMWIGVWTAIFLLLFLAFGLSIYIRYLTRFTLEVFLLLIGFCVVYNASSMLYEIKMLHPLKTPYFQEHSCVCLKYIENETRHSAEINNSGNLLGSGNLRNSSDLLGYEAVEYLNVSFGECVLNNGELVGGGCHTGVYFLSLLLALCTLFMVSILARLRSSGYFPRVVSKLYNYMHFLWYEWSRCNVIILNLLTMFKSSSASWSLIITNHHCHRYHPHHLSLSLSTS